MGAAREPGSVALWQHFGPTHPTLQFPGGLRLILGWSHTQASIEAASLLMMVARPAAATSAALGASVAPFRSTRHGSTFPRVTNPGKDDGCASLSYPSQR